MRRRGSVRWALAAIAGLGVILGSYRAGKDTAELPVLVWITRTGKAYHRETCRHVIGRGIAVRLDEARANFRRCRVCSPPK